MEVYHKDVNPIEVYPIEAYPIGEGAVEVSGCSPLKNIPCSFSTISYVWMWRMNVKWWMPGDFYVHM